MLYHSASESKTLLEPRSAHLSSLRSINGTKGAPESDRRAEAPSDAIRGNCIEGANPSLSPSFSTAIAVRVKQPSGGGNQASLNGIEVLSILVIYRVSSHTSILPL